ncbi:MAG: alpha/beta hydrolase [Bacteroidia bacterium]|nr:alpha/beta hydrolase [Bacteroidia bacterium]
MKIHRKSFFKNPEKDFTYLKNWGKQLEEINGYTYHSLKLISSLGETHIWTHNLERQDLPTLILFPGARTTVLFWDLDNKLKTLRDAFRLILVETNGLPNFSKGNSPNIKSLDYGKWGKEILDQLELDKVFLAGASFGGEVAMKIGIVAPERIQSIFLFNSAGLSPFSLGWTNLYYNLLPVFKTSRKNVQLFLEKLVFQAPEHVLSEKAMKLVIDYEVFAIKQYKDKTQKPYFMGKELQEVKPDTYVFEGDADLLFPYNNSLKNARKYLPNLKGTEVFTGVGHGIETYGPAIQKMEEIIRTYA